MIFLDSAFIINNSNNNVLEFNVFEEVRVTRHSSPVFPLRKWLGAYVPKTAGGHPEPPDQFGFSAVY